MKKTTAVEVLPTKIGTPFEGGIYIGREFVDADAFVLIAAPKADGEIADTTFANALKKAKALKIGGKKDWALPTRLEALLLWQAQEKLTAAEKCDAVWHWTSEPYASNADCAWFQSFSYGFQDFYDRSAQLRARAVRRFKI